MQLKSYQDVKLYLIGMIAIMGNKVKRHGMYNHDTEVAHMTSIIKKAWDKERITAIEMARLLEYVRDEVRSL